MKIATWIIIAVLCFVIVIQNECHHCPKPEPCPEADTVQTIKIIKGDSVPHELPAVIADKPDSIVYQTIPHLIDSSAVAKAYYSKVYGYAVLINDSSMYAGFRYMVEQNRLQWFIPNVANKRPTAIIHNTSIIESVKPKNKYFAGLGVGRSLSSFALAPSLALLTKKDHLYSIHYDVINNEVYFSMYWKIGK